MDDRCTKKYQTQTEAETEERVRKYGGVDKERGRRRGKAEGEAHCQVAMGEDEGVV